jgi:cupin fold WbuC family metalloprotein
MSATGGAASRSSAAGEHPARGLVEFVTRDLLAQLAEASMASPRLRANHDFHDHRDHYQRLLNVIQPQAYIQPHRHRDPGKSETFVVLRGEIAFFHFDEQGRVLTARRLGPQRDALAVDMQPGVWHCVIALTPDCVIFEGKNGPYDPATDKEFAAWAPAEGDAAAAEYMRRLLAQAE